MRIKSNSEKSLFYNNKITFEVNFSLHQSRMNQKQKMAYFRVFF